MENLVYALIAVMVVDAGLLVFFVVRTILKSKAEKEKDRVHKNKNGAHFKNTAKNSANETLKEEGSSDFDKNSANETAKSAQKTPKLADKSPKKEEKTEKVEKTKKAKQKLTKRSSFGKIKVNEEALKKILAGYDEKENAKKADVAEDGASEKDETTQNLQPSTEENLDAVFEDFKVEEPATKEKFSSPFRRASGHRAFAPKPPKEEDDYDDFGDDDDFEDDIEKAYQDFLTRKKQEYLKKYESNFDDETDDEMNDHIGEINDETDDDEDFFEDEPSNSPLGKEKQSKFNELQENKKLPKGASQAYTIEDFKDDYFNKKEDISLILSKLSEVDKNKILSILLSKESIDESDFD